jgi:hypothetical protein
MNTTKALLIAALAALVGLPACGDLQNNTINVDLVGYTPDGSLVMFTRAGIEIYDGVLQRRINHISLEALAVPPYPLFNYFGYSLSPDGTAAAVLYYGTPDDALPVNTKVAIYSIPDGRLLNLFELDDKPPPYTQGITMAFSLSPRGKLFYVAESILSETDSGVTGTPQSRLFDTATGALSWSKDGWWIQPVWSADGGTLFGAKLGNTDYIASSLDALDASSGMPTWTIDMTGTMPSFQNLSALALVGNGTLLTGVAYSPPTLVPCGGPDAGPGDCSPIYPIVSASDGASVGQLPALPHTTFTELINTGFNNFVCNATDTCAARLSDFTSNQVFYLRVFKTDGTELQRIPIGPGGASGEAAMAISPDGQFVATAADYAQGGVKVFSVADGKVVGSRSFPVDTF